MVQTDVQICIMYSYFRHQDRDYIILESVFKKTYILNITWKYYSQLCLLEKCQDSRDREKTSPVQFFKATKNDHFD